MWRLERKERYGRLGEEMQVYGGGGCKAKRDEVVRNDMKELGLASVDALDRHAWKDE